MQLNRKDIMENGADSSDESSDDEGSRFNDEIDSSDDEGGVIRPSRPLQKELEWDDSTLKI